MNNSVNRTWATEEQIHSHMPLQECPGYRCALCSSVCRSKNSLHSHMSRKHRGIPMKSVPLVPATEQKVPETTKMSGPDTHGKSHSVGTGRRSLSAKEKRVRHTTTPLPSTPATDLTMPRLYYCPYCDTVVPNAANLKEHLNKRHALSSLRESNSNDAMCKLNTIWESSYN